MHPTAHANKGKSKFQFFFLATFLWLSLCLQSTRKLNEMRQIRHNLKALLDSILVNISIMMNFAIGVSLLCLCEAIKFPFFLRSRRDRWRPTLLHRQCVVVNACLNAKVWHANCEVLLVRRSYLCFIYFISGFLFLCLYERRSGGGVRAKLRMSDTTDSDTFIVEQMWIVYVCWCGWMVCRSMGDCLSMCWCHVCAYTLVIGTKHEAQLPFIILRNCVLFRRLVLVFDKTACWTNTVMDRSGCAYQPALLCEFSKKKNEKKSKWIFLLLIVARIRRILRTYTHAKQPTRCCNFFVQWHGRNILLFCFIWCNKSLIKYLSIGNRVSECVSRRKHTSSHSHLRKVYRDIS